MDNVFGVLVEQLRSPVGQFDKVPIHCREVGTVKIRSAVQLIILAIPQPALKRCPHLIAYGVPIRIKSELLELIVSRGAPHGPALAQRRNDRHAPRLFVFSDSLAFVEHVVTGMPIQSNVDDGMVILPGDALGGIVLEIAMRLISHV